MSLSPTYRDAVTGEIAKGLGNPFILYEGMKKIKGSNLTTSSIILKVSMNSIRKRGQPQVVSTSAAKSISMPLVEWGMAMELAKHYKQSSLSKAVKIAVRAAYFKNCER